jgi:hypothetical protein
MIDFVIAGDRGACCSDGFTVRERNSHLCFILHNLLGYIILKEPQNYEKSFSQLERQLKICQAFDENSKVVLKKMLFFVIDVVVVFGYDGDENVNSH